MTHVERLEPLHCLGESHCLRFRDRLYRSEQPARLLHARCHFLPSVEASNFTTNGGLHQDLAAVLLAAGLCSERRSEDGTFVIEATHRASTFAERVLAARHAALADEPLQAPALLLFAGDKELHSLAVAIGPGVDFELPDDPGYGRLPGAERVPYDTVEAAFAARLAPFVLGLRMLHEAGFDRTLVHGLLPRVRDDARNAQWCHGVPIAAVVRSKLAIVGNRLLAAAARDAGLGFVDVWSDLATDGHLDPRFDLDGLHANHAATEASLPTVVQRLAELEAGHANAAQYELQHELAVERSPAAEPCAAAFAAHGFVAWSAAQQPGLAGLTAERLVAGFDGSAVQALLEVGWGRECGLVGLAEGTPGEALPPPAGAASLRAAVYAPRQPLHVRCMPGEGAGPAASLTLAPGSLLVFDPARVSLQCEPPTADVLQMFVLPRLPAEATQVVRLSKAAWPADPFRVVGTGERDAPRIARRWREIAGRTVATSS